MKTITNVGWKDLPRVTEGEDTVLEEGSDDVEKVSVAIGRRSEEQG